ncbi:MAG: Ig-like domain-containing protein [Bacteroidota bacterium]
MKKNIYFVLALFVIFLSNCEKKEVNTNPECEITSPVDGDVFVPGEDIFISIIASDNEGEVEEVRLYLDGYLVETFTDSPYEFTWSNTWDFSLGNYSFEAIAVDEAGAETSHTISFSLEQGLIYNSVIYNLDMGTLEYYGLIDNTSTYDNFDVTLFSNILNNRVDSIYFELFSSSEIDIANGEYYFDRYTQNQFTFDYSDFFLDFDSSTGTGIVGVVSDGLFKIDRTGNIYRIFLDCTSSTGKPIIGYYEGVLAYFDRTLKSESGFHKKRKFPLKTDY